MQLESGRRMRLCVYEGKRVDRALYRSDPGYDERVVDLTSPLPSFPRAGPLRGE